MAKLYFRYGAMGSSKTANALMVAYNYNERGKKALLAKPLTDTREIGVMHSRIGLEQPCISVEELVQMNDAALKQYDCFIIDEAQFCRKSDIEFFVHIVDDLGIPVICYGLRADFQQIFSRAVSGYLRGQTRLKIKLSAGVEKEPVVMQGLTRKAESSEQEDR